MFLIIIAVIIRNFSNSFLNVFQKILTSKGEFSSIVNFYTYLGLMILGVLTCPNPIFDKDILSILLVMGFLGALGNFFIIKALSLGELSSLAPINSYKPIIALILGIFLIKEIPEFHHLLGILMIIIGTFILSECKMFYNKATFYRFLALFFSGTEAIFIKKTILLTNVNSAFLYWAFAGFIFSTLFALTSRHPFRIKNSNIKYQILLIIMVALMQYATNYTFKKINVAYALALFQLSSIVSVFLGVNIFRETGFVRKIIASLIMLLGAVIIIIS